LVDLSFLTLFITDLVALFSVYFIVTSSLNIEFGYTGIPNFGKVLAVSGGAFVAGFLPIRFLGELTGITRGLQAFGHNEILVTCVREFAFRKEFEYVLQRMDYVRDNVAISTCLNRLLAQDPLLSISLLLLTILAAAAVGGVLGYVSSYPAIRLREDYLAMTLLAMGEVLFVIGYNVPELVGGTLGVSTVDVYQWVGPGSRFLLATLVLLLVAIAAYLYMEGLSTSPLGRVMRAVRDRELAAEVLGKDVVKVRQRVLVVSSAMAAVAGALWALYLGGVIALSYDRVTWTFWPWVMVIIGGAANNLGVVLGTAIFVTSRKVIDFYKGGLQFLLPFDVVWLDRLALGIVLIAMLIARPEGILPEKPRLALPRYKILGLLEKVRGSSS
jgi:branched-chain amino acid transport system permease protein